MYFLQGKHSPGQAWLKRFLSPTPSCIDVLGPPAPVSTWPVRPSPATKEHLPCAEHRSRSQQGSPGTSGPNALPSHADGLAGKADRAEEVRTRSTRGGA